MQPTYKQPFGKSFIKYFFGSTILCFLYLIAVQLGYALYHAALAVKDGAGYQAPFGADVVYLAAMWIPFLLLLLRLARKRGFWPFLIYCREAFQKHWFKFGMYFLVLYAIRQNMWVGNYYVELPSGGIWLDSAFGSAAAMNFVHFLAETASTFLLFLGIPFFCYVSWKMKDFPPARKVLPS